MAACSPRRSWLSGLTSTSVGCGPPRVADHALDSPGSIRIVSYRPGVAMSDRTPGVPVRFDPRGPRFAALLTTLVLLVVLVTGSGVLLAAQAVVFALGAVLGLRRSPYGWLYRRLV